MATEDDRTLEQLISDAELLLATRDFPAPEAPKPALVDGKPIVVGTLPDGRPILVAAGAKGQPWKDEKGDYVVIDPQDGQVRFKLKRRHEQSVPRMKDLDQVLLVQKQLALHPPGFLAFARAVKPVKKLAKSLQQRVWSFFAVLLGVVGWFESKARAAVIRVRKTALNLADRLRPPVTTLNVGKLTGVERYLSKKALLLLQSEVKSTLYKTTAGKIVPCWYANMRVPLEPDGSVHDEYIRRWANFLNDMAARDIWKYGTLAGPSILHLPTVALRWEANLFTFFFSDHQGSLAEMNELAGFPVFGQEGSVDVCSDWENFPW